jgi:hypothetical protein
VCLVIEHSAGCKTDSNVSNDHLNWIFRTNSVAPTDVDVSTCIFRLFLESIEQVETANDRIDGVLCVLLQSCLFQIKWLEWPTSMGGPWQIDRLFLQHDISELHLPHLLPVGVVCPTAWPTPEQPRRHEDMVRHLGTVHREDHACRIHHLNTNLHTSVPASATVTSNQSWPDGAGHRNLAGLALVDLRLPWPWPLVSFRHELHAGDEICSLSSRSGYHQRWLTA